MSLSTENDLVLSDVITNTRMFLFMIPLPMCHKFVKCGEYTFKCFYIRISFKVHGS